MPGLLARLVARAVLDPDADRDRGEVGQLLGEHPDAVRKPRGAHAVSARPPCARVSRSASLRERRILPDLSTSRTLTSITSPSLTTSVTCCTRSLASCEMCTRPSVPGRISTKAPKSTIAPHRAVVDLADLGLGREAVDAVDAPSASRRRRPTRRSTVPSSSTSILHAGLLDDAADGLAAGADEVADLVGLDLERDDARRVASTAPRAAPASASSILPRMWSRAVARLLERLLHDLARQAADLDVHLQGGDAVARCRRP